jgi:hypothetical protein
MKFVAVRWVGLMTHRECCVDLSIPIPRYLTLAKVGGSTFALQFSSCAVASILN